MLSWTTRVCTLTLLLVSVIASVTWAQQGPDTFGVGCLDEQNSLTRQQVFERIKTCFVEDLGSPKFDEETRWGRIAIPPVDKAKPECPTQKDHSDTPTESRSPRWPAFLMLLAVCALCLGWQRSLHEI
jgi:hypothetical protein